MSANTDSQSDMQLCFYQPAVRFARGRLVLRLLCCFLRLYICASALITCTIITSRTLTANVYISFKCFRGLYEIRVGCICFTGTVHLTLAKRSPMAYTCIVTQKTGPGIPSELHSGDSSRFSCFYTLMTSFQAPLKLYGARALAYFLKFPIACMCLTICDVTFSNALGRLVECEQKGWDSGRWVGVYTQRVKIHVVRLCLGLVAKIPHQSHFSYFNPFLDVARYIWHETSIL